MVSQLPKTFRPPLSEFTEYNLGTAILYTLAYSDLFDYPLTAKEIQRYLIGFRADIKQVRIMLPYLQEGALVARGKEYFALPGRENTFVLRQMRSDLSTVLWHDAVRYGRWISKLPFVRMVAATGALVSNNVEAGADLDYFIIAEPGWLWTTRAMILALDRVAARSGTGARICPNYIITTNSLVLPEADLFTAQEMTRMVPMSGFGLYHKFRRENSWTDDFLPNAQGYPWQLANGFSIGKNRSTVERIMDNPVARQLEQWEMQRKIRKFSGMTSENNETRFSADLCKGHFDGHKAQTLQAFEDRIRGLGICK